MKAAKRLKSVQEYYFSRKLREVRERVAAGQDIINLGIGSPDFSATQQRDPGTYRKFGAAFGTQIPELSRNARVAPSNCGLLPKLFWCNAKSGT